MSTMTERFTGGHGQLALGVCYYPEHWPTTDWAEDAAQMAALGLRYVRIGEFAWSRLEPQPGVFNFAWLDEAISTLADAGLQVVLCTPTATPPKWLVDAHPEMLPVEPATGAMRGFGSRRHYDFSSAVYRRESARITLQLARRYGQDPRVVGWQTDNELCCHDTTHSASPGARAGFQEWCEVRYGTIDALNIAWGNVFWSMEYPDFAAIELPFGAVTETNPAHQLAYRRFASDAVLSFHSAQVQVLRENTQGQWITHNFIPMKDTQTDCVALAADLDFVSYDSYPLGRSEFLLGRDHPEEARRYMRTGHPDYTAYWLDQCRGLRNRGFWIMEQQPGPVNWAPANPRPAPGMVTLWTVEAIAHGADVVSYFRWRQARFAQEQMHAGLLGPDRSRADAWAEVETAVGILAALEGLDLPSPRGDAAMVVDVTAQWVAEIEVQGKGYDTNTVQFQFYKALRRLGIAVDIVGPDADLSSYQLVVVPSLPMVPDALIDACQSTGALVLFGPRSGAKTDEFQIPADCAPGVLQQLIEVRVNSVETLRPEVTEPFTYRGEPVHSRLWCEDLTVGNAEVAAHYQEDRPALVRGGRFAYLSTLTDDAFLDLLLTDLLEECGIGINPPPEDVRLMRRGEVSFAWNYGNVPRHIDLPRGATLLWGNREMPAHGVCIWRESNAR